MAGPSFVGSGRQWRGLAQDGAPGGGSCRRHGASGGDVARIVAHRAAASSRMMLDVVSRPATNPLCWGDPPRQGVAQRTVDRCGDGFGGCVLQGQRPSLRSRSVASAAGARVGRLGALRQKHRDRLVQLRWHRCGGSGVECDQRVWAWWPAYRHALYGIPSGPGAESGHLRRMARNIVPSGGR